MTHENDFRNHQREQDASIDLREYISILRSRKWTLILITPLVIAGALAFSYRQTPLYTASARVLVQPSQENSAEVPSNLRTVEILTESEIADSEPVAERVQQELGLPDTPPALLSNLQVDAVTETRVLVLTYTAVRPELAADVANSFAENYISYRRDQALEVITSMQSSVQDRVDNVSDELNRVDDELERLGGADDSTLKGTLEDSRNLLLARLAVLQQQLSDLQPNEAALGGGDVIESAQVPGGPSTPNHALNGLLGAAVGLALAIGLALLKERLDDRFRGRNDVERVTESPVLATIPRYQAPKAKRRKRAQQSLITATQPKGIAAEAYRSLRTSLQFIVSQQGLKSIVITSATASEGKSATSANLAVVLAQAGVKVILVSGDLRRPTVERYFDVPREPGLTSWLMDNDRDFYEVIANPHIPNLRVVPCGPIPGNPTELLTSTKLGEMIKVLEQNADLVIIDSPPVMPVSDSSILASRTDGVLLVVNASSTHRSAAMRAKQELERSGGRLIGTVLNGFEASKSPYHYYYEDRRYYAAYVSDEPAEDTKTSSKAEKRHAPSRSG